MTSLQKRTGSLLATLVLATAWGCEGGSTPSASSSNAQANVSGTVTIGGKPATEGEVVFDPGNVNRKGAPTAKAPIGKDGSYSTKTLVGENVIYIRGPAADKDRNRSQFRKNIDIKSGDNAVNVEVP